MAECILLQAGGGGLDPDELTATAGDVLKGMLAGVKGYDDPVYGTLELTGTAADSQVLAGQTYYNTNAKGKRTGSMPNRGAPTAALNCGGAYNLAAGYYSGGKVTANSLASQTPANATAGQILSGFNAWVNGSKINGSMATQGGKNVMPGRSNQVICAGGRYVTGDQLVYGDANLLPENIARGKTIFGVPGTAYVIQVGPSDLYNRGVNNANFRPGTEYDTSAGGTKNTAVIEGAQISVNPNNNKILRVAFTANLTGYSYINILFYFKAIGTDNLASVVLYNSGSSTLSNQQLNKSSVLNRDNTVSLSISNAQTSGTFHIKIESDDLQNSYRDNIYGTVIKRVWLS